MEDSTFKLRSQFTQQTREFHLEKKCFLGLETMKSYDSFCYGRVACDVSEFQQYVLELFQKSKLQTLKSD